MISSETMVCSRKETHLSIEHRAARVGIRKILFLDQRLDLSFRDMGDADMPNGQSTAAVPESRSMDNVKSL